MRFQGAIIRLLISTKIILEVVQNILLKWLLNISLLGARIMFFHVDESGNTGNNLFDENQPRLSYGVLSSVRNADVLCVKLYKEILNSIDGDIIHANELGIGGLVEIAPQLMAIQKKLKFDFDYYYIEKKDYALFSFFERVFDPGINDAVKWDAYWTPLRFLLIHKLSILFDEQLLRESWRLATAKRIENCEEAITGLLSEVMTRTSVSSLDRRSKEVITDALRFGIDNPLSMDFGFPDHKLVSPNSVGFQFVISAIARRTRGKKRQSISSIIVDRQTEFNKSQIKTHKNALLISKGLKNAKKSEEAMIVNHPTNFGYSTDDIIIKGLTDREITISKSADSIGLQIVDVYLWLANKIISGGNLPPALNTLCSTFVHRSIIDGVSLDGITQRFHDFEKQLPRIEELTAEDIAKSNDSIEHHRKKVIDLIG